MESRNIKTKEEALKAFEDYKKSFILVLVYENNITEPALDSNDKILTFETKELAEKCIQANIKEFPSFGVDHAIVVAFDDVCELSINFDKEHPNQSVVEHNWRVPKDHEISEEELLGIIKKHQEEATEKAIGDKND